MLEDTTVSVTDVTSGDTKVVTIKCDSPILAELQKVDQENRECFVYVLSYQIDGKLTEIIPCISPVN